MSISEHYYIAHGFHRLHAQYVNTIDTYMRDSLTLKKKNNLRVARTPEHKPLKNTPSPETDRLTGSKTEHLGPLIETSVCSGQSLKQHVKDVHNSPDNLPRVFSEPNSDSHPAKRTCQEHRCQHETAMDLTETDSSWRRISEAKQPPFWVPYNTRSQ